MLPLPELNNQSYDDLLATAKKQLASIFPQWTDHSSHDPGITLVELLSYLTEKQQQSLLEIGQDNVLKFLELVNMVPEPAQAAKTQVLFSGLNELQHFPPRTKLSAEKIVFETEHRVLLTSNIITGVMIKDERGEQLIDFASLDKPRVYAPLGLEPQPDNQFVIYFKQPLISRQQLQLNIGIEHPYSVLRNPILTETNFSPIVQLSWEYYGLDSDGHSGWHPLDIIKDTTYDLLFSGFLVFSVAGEHLSFNYPTTPTGELSYCIRCTLGKTKYDVPPRFNQLLINCSQVVQRDTLCQSFVFTKDQVVQGDLIIDSYLAYYYPLDIYVTQQGSWVTIEDAGLTYSIIKDPVLKTCSLKLLLEATNHKYFNTDDYEAVMVVAYKPDFHPRASSASSMGWANQSLELGIKNINPLDFKLLVGCTQPNGTQSWQQWYRVNTLAGAHANYPCYQLDHVNGILTFGDNQQGLIPPKGEGNLLIVSCSVTHGSKGNIHTDKIRGLLEPQQEPLWEQLQVAQLLPAIGGQEAETITQAQMRARLDLQQNVRAVTTADYGKILAVTPGLMINRVKVLPLYKPGLEGYPQKKSDNCMTLVVEPYSESGLGRLTPGYIRNLHNQLEPYRLLTTRVYVVEPEYIGLDVEGEIVIKSNFANAAQIVNEKLIYYINKFQEEQRGLYYGDIYGALDLLDLVSHIRYLSLELLGSRAVKTSGGDIQIPPHGRLYLRQNNLVFVNSEYY